MFDSTRHLGLDEVLELIDAICLSWAGGAREQGLEKKIYGQLSAHIRAQTKSYLQCSGTCCLGRAYQLLRYCSRSSCDAGITLRLWSHYTCITPGTR